MTLPLIVLLPLAGAILPALFIRRGRNASALSAGAVALASLVLLFTLAGDVFSGQVVQSSWEWMPQLGINFSFMADGLGFLFALLILGIGLLVILYARYYLHADDPMGRFYAFLMIFMAAMLGIVLSNNIILLIVFWELTSLSSFLLIGYWKHLPEARQGARMALAITGGGGLALLGGFLILGNIVGSYELTEILRSGAMIQASPLYVPALLLILLGAFTKSAQFPFHFWLPHAMAAPTPVSAYLHSATMVKAGVFLLARMWPALAGTEIWFFLVTGTGLVTLFVGAYVALLKHDLKGLLAYSTVSHLGLITVLFGIGTASAAVVGVFHIINHAAFKAGLFMTAGIVDHEAGTRDIRRLGGLWSLMPITATLALFAAASMAGVPPFNGFLSKEMFFEGTLHLEFLPDLPWLVPAIVTLAGVFSVAYSVRFVVDVFLGDVTTEAPKTAHEPPRGMRIPVEILVLLCVAIGLAPNLVVGPLLAVAAGASIGAVVPDYSIALWHGFNVPLLMSGIAVAGGFLVFAARGKFFRLHEVVLPARLPRIEGKRFFDAFVAGVVRVAGACTDGLENGSLQRYLSILLVAAVALASWPFLGGEWSRGVLPATPIDGISVAAWGMLAIAALATVVFHRERFVAVIMISVVGLMVALAFVHFSAPDLALTQLSVEVVTIVLLLLALHLLPRKGVAETSPSRNARDIGVALLAGAGVTFVSWLLLTRPLESISAFHLAESYPGGGGTNVVNVILVDFRGFDTFGEIIVLGIAALGIYALIDGLGIPPEWKVGEMEDEKRYPLLLTTIARLLLPLALLVALYLMLRGHNQPGGGFIAGLVASVALIIQYIASGIGWTQERLHRDFHTIIGAGVLMAGLTGLGAFIFGAPFLTTWFDYFEWPVIGRFELASALAFDLGVFFTVVGAVLLVLVNMGKIATGHSARLAARFDVEGK